MPLDAILPFSPPAQIVTVLTNLPSDHWAGFWSNLIVGGLTLAAGVLAFFAAFKANQIARRDQTKATLLALLEASDTLITFLLPSSFTLSQYKKALNQGNDKQSTAGAVVDWDKAEQALIDFTFREPLKVKVLSPDGNTRRARFLLPDNISLDLITYIRRYQDLVFGIQECMLAGDGPRGNGGKPLRVAEPKRLRAFFEVQNSQSLFWDCWGRHNALTEQLRSLSTEYAQRLQRIIDQSSHL